MLLVAAMLGGVEAHAAGLDMIEVGGAYGTVAATNPTAIWWNPAGLAVRGGTQFLVEGAPTFGGATIDRDNPNYGELTPVDGFPTAYDYSGTERFSSIGVVPFLGVSSDFGLDGLGVGVGLYVPTAKAAKTDQAWGPNRFAAREGSIRAAHVSLGASYRVAELLAIGLSGSIVDSSFSATTDASVLPDLAWTVKQVYGLDALEPQHQDGLIEDRAYSSTLKLGAEAPLHDRTFTFGGGLYLTPIDKLGISVAWNQGVKLAHTGDLSLTFQCPPEADVNGRAAADLGGTCNRTVAGEIVEDDPLTYRLPSRLHLGVALLPVERVRLELMGAYVGWGVLDDYAVSPRVSPSDLGTDPNYTGPSSQIISRDRLIARNGRDTFWVGVDGKVDVLDQLTVGGRLTFDRAAIPIEYVSASNLDADTLIVMAMAQYRPLDQLGIGLSYSFHASGARTVTDSAFSTDIASSDPDSADYFYLSDATNRVYYPSTNGRYALGIHRIGISVQGRFGEGGLSFGL